MSKSPTELKKNLVQLDMLNDELQAKLDKPFPDDQLYKVLWTLLDPAILKS